MLAVKRYPLDLFAYSLVCEEEDLENLHLMDNAKNFLVSREGIYKALSGLDARELHVALLKVLGNLERIVILDEKGYVFVPRKNLTNLLQYV